MTVAALRALLDQELPHVPRHPAPHLPHIHFTAKETPMQTAAAGAPHPARSTLRRLPAPAPGAERERETERIPVGELLAWADKHQDPAIQDQSARARADLTGLRARHQADRELAAITAEAEQLERRLTEIRRRQSELRPKRKTKRDYDSAEVRVWARANGHTVPDRGQIPKKVLQAWRERQTPQ